MASDWRASFLVNMTSLLSICVLNMHWLEYKFVFKRFSVSKHFRSEHKAFARFSSI